MDVRRLGKGETATWRDAVAGLLQDPDNEELLSATGIDAALGDDRCYLVVAEDGEGVAGLLSAYRFPNLTSGGALVYLYDVEVHERCRKKGVGQQLLECLLKCCREDNVNTVWAGTSIGNTSARNLFERTGAMVVGDSYVEYEWHLERSEK